MNVNLNAEMGAQVRTASKMLGFKEQEIVQRALLFYLNALDKEMELKRELSEWDSVSDEALLRFERSL